MARSGLEAHLGPDLTIGVRTALARYVERTGQAPRPAAYPRFLSRRDPAPTTLEVEVDIDPALDAGLRRLAEEQGVTARELVSHAILNSLAELDAAAESRYQGDWRGSIEGVPIDARSHETGDG